MGLPVQELALALAGLRFNLTLLAANPWNLRGHVHLQRLLIGGVRGSKSHPTIRRVHRQVKVLDVLADEFQLDASQGHVRYSF